MKTQKVNPQAAKIIELFGGVQALAKVLHSMRVKIAVTSIYRWTYPKEVGGTGGFIPTRSLPLVLKAAHKIGIFISAEDLDIRS